MSKNHPELKAMLKQGGCWFLALMPYLPIPEGVSTREQYRHLTRKRSWQAQVSFDRALHLLCLLLLLALVARGQTPSARATAAAPAYTESQVVPLSVDLSGALRTSGGGGSGGGLTDAQLRASPVPMSLSSIPLATNAATESTLTSVLGRLPALVTGRIPVDGSGVTQPVSGTVAISGSVPVTGTFWQATQPVSGTVTANAGTGTFAVSGPLTDAQLRAVAVPVSGTFWQATQPISGTVTANAGTGTMAVSGPLTDGQLRATAVPVSGTFWQATQPVSAASLPLPTGAATAAKQPALGTAGTASADVISVQGIASGTPLRVDLGATTANATSLNVNCTGGCAGASEAQVYTWTVPDVVAGSNKLFLDLFNAVGSAKVIKVRGIYPIMRTEVAVVGVLGLRWDLFRTSAVGTGGTPAVYQSATRDVAGGSIVPLDFNNASLPAQITARHLPTGGATAAAWLGRRTCFVEETNAATYWCNGSFNFLEQVSGGQPLVLREGQGLLIQQGSVATLNNIAFTVVFSVE